MKGLKQTEQKYAPVDKWVMYRFPILFGLGFAGTLVFAMLASI